MFVLDADDDSGPLDRLMDQLDFQPDDADDYEDAHPFGEKIKSRHLKFSIFSQEINILFMIFFRF